MLGKTLNELISLENRHQEYLLQDYVAYCDEIRRRVKSLTREQVSAEPDAVKFFQKNFVEEMEPLSKIGQHHFGSNKSEVRVQYLKEDPPDGRLFCANTEEEICIEFTSARDNLLEAAVLDMNRQGMPASTTGHTYEDVSGSKRKGYGISGNAVEAEFLDEIVEKQKSRILGAIEKKLVQDWGKKNNWLCVLIPDYEWSSASDGRSEYEELLRLALKEILQTHRDTLLAKNVSTLCFIGYESWLSIHPLIRTS